MDLRRPVFPSPAVTSANQLNAVTTCQSSGCINSCFGQPVNVSVQANPSIRCIRPNTVKSRANAFEKNDSDVAKELPTPKTVIAGNSRTKASAFPQPVKTAESRHLVVQPSKTVDRLEHTEIPSVQTVKFRDEITKSDLDTKRSPECRSPPLPVHRNVCSTSSIETSTSGHSASEKSPDIVTQRLKMFENKPVMQNKPPLLPKPKSPENGAKYVSVNRSTSVDSVTQYDVGCQRNRSFYSPSADRVQLHDDTVVSRGASPKMPNKSLETRETVLPKPPKKPPRMTVMNPRQVTPVCDNSYGLLVYAAGAAAPSVHVEPLSVDVGRPGDTPVQNISDWHIADVRSHLKSHDGRNPERSVPKSVLNTSWLQNNVSVRSNVASQLSPVSDAWEKKFIRAPKNSPPVRSRGKKENFVTKKRINNPNYMYVCMHTDDIIPSQHRVVTEHKAVTRHHSDDMLNLPPSPSRTNPKSPPYRERLYAAPYEFAMSSNNAAMEHQVLFDSAGYALPNLEDSPQFQVNFLCFVAWLLYYCAVYFGVRGSPYRMTHVQSFF